MAIYNSKGPEEESLWCPVMHCYHAAAYRQAAHLVPHHIGQTLMTMIFGAESAANLFSTRNGLLLDNVIKSAFDRHHIVIDPANLLPPGGPVTEWKVRVLDKLIHGKALWPGPDSTS